MSFLSQRSTPGPWVKLCGVRDVPTAVALAALQPDALGLNFYAPSPRSVSSSQAAAISAAVGGSVERVGVFVNASLEELLRTVDEANLSAVQLHGDEPASLIVAVKQARPDLPVIRAWRLAAAGSADVGRGELRTLDEYLAVCRDAGACPDAVLIDAGVPGAYGGTGRTVKWELLRQYCPEWPPLILAGGLTPENVAAACQTVQPWGIDTAGGVESAKGVKDPARAAAFLTAVRSSRVS